jgi:hypothetical protein
MTLSVFQATITDQSGDVQAGAEVEVVNEATGLPATLYSTRGGAATTNPMFADADGFAQFYTEPGEYRITATSGVFSKTWRYVRIGDAGGKDAATVARNGDYMTYGGTANAITLTSANTLPNSTLNVGDRIRFKATITNTGPTTITVDGGPNTACVTPTGVALPAGFIRTDVITECEYDGSNFVVKYGELNTFNIENYDPFTFDGVGSQMLVVNISGGVLSSSSSFSGASIKPAYFSVGGTLLQAPGVLTGVWRNIGGGSFTDGQAFTAVKISS